MHGFEALGLQTLFWPFLIQGHGPAGGSQTSSYVKGLYN